MSVVIPVLDEEATIGACIDAIGAQDYGPINLEVIVVDGQSSDGTVLVAQAHLERWPFARGEVIVHRGRSRPANLNRGLAAATGSVVCRVDARSRLGTAYVSQCAAILADRADVAVVGGRQHALPAAHSVAEMGIARALNNRWGMGGARYRRSTAPGPTDTVYLGTFRAALLRAAGGWDERLAVNEDFDLARRMSRLGLVWFDPALEVAYVPRSSLSAIARQYAQFGRGKVRYWRLSSDRPRPRQMIAAAGLPLALGLGVGLLALSNRRGWVLGAGLTGGAIVELLGADGPDGPPAAHLISAVTLGVASVSWVAGLWSEVLRRSGTGPRLAPCPD